MSAAATKQFDFSQCPACVYEIATYLGSGEEEKIRILLTNKNIEIPYEHIKSDHPPHSKCLQNLEIIDPPPKNIKIVLPGNPPMKKSEYIYESETDRVYMRRT